ncbi:cytosolic 5'-nucleotidase 1A isoform X2 [Myripristis murdjan]|uniref:cytosolic 5'-nucleotidase 1A isoform X2 n=1 Tax=Myripristis murdjan TaxID=586833 RepID=UPI0011760A49|nr:cytosolic 5'-nucleotidase 1A-like isoform X2 [Myripristis murdjan]
MVSTVRNPEAKQDAQRALVVALTCQELFHLGGAEVSSSEPYAPGVAFPLLQAMQVVNERLLELNPEETLLFDVVLLAADCQQHQDRIIATTRHYGLDVSRFCFCSRDEFTHLLLRERTHLFLCTDARQVATASHTGVAAALLQPAPSRPTQQLRVLFCTDPADRPGTSQQVCQVAGLLGAMRSRLGVACGALSIILLTVQGGRESCGRALLTLRSWGLGVDEAYCLAGAPGGPALSLLAPHILFPDGSALQA